MKIHRGNLFLRASVLFTACAPLFAALHPESGNFIFQRYEPKTYGASPQNWAVLQDLRGVMYFGNTEGVLEFDGVHWRRIELPNNGTVRSLALDDRGVVFAGGQGEFGYLEAGPGGAPRYVSLVPKLPSADRKFGDVRSVLVTPDGIFFSAPGRLIRYQTSGAIKSWKSTAPFGRAFLINGVPHVVVIGVGLHRVQGDELQPVSGGEKFQKSEIRGIFQQGAEIFIATTKGIFRQTLDGFEAFATSEDEFLRANGLYSTLQLADGSWALGTARGGLLLMDSTGKLLRSISKDNGLPSDYIAAAAPDRQGGIWLATGNGLVRFDTKLTDFDDRNGLKGEVFSIARWQGTLYVGTASGLFRLKPPVAAAAPEFEAVPGIRETVVTLLAREDGLWIGGKRGLFRFSDGKVEPIFATDVIYGLASSATSSEVLYAVGSGAFVFRRNGNSWTKIAELSAAGQEFRTVAEDPNGLVWITSRTAVTHVDFRQTPYTIQSFGEAAGLPAGWKYVFRNGSRIVFATEKGLLRFAQNEKRFVAEQEYGTMFSDGSHGVQEMRQDVRGNVWITGAGYHGILSRAANDVWSWNPMILLRAGMDELYAIQTDGDQVTWASGPDGRLARYQNTNPGPSAPFEILVRRVVASDRKDVVYGGLGSPLPTRLGYQENTLRIEFAAPFYDAPQLVEYQFSSDGGATFSGWSKETWKDLGNLWEGAYTFRVRARNPYGQLSPQASFALDVSPPWYRTLWAYAAYLTLGIGCIWLLLRWRLRQLHASNVRLEALVEERTTEIRRQRDQIQEQEAKTEALLLNILPAPVASELRSTGAVVPMHFDDVTVCFTDFVGFTVSSEKMQAQDLVEKLHEYFTAFDQIVTRYGLEKLKTIGDAYMFVSGLPEPRPSHAVDGVIAALEILEKAKELAARPGGMPWRLRIGLHSGPVVAGVVGVQKFAFDIWGDTVNLASRMESSGAPDRVNLSERTYRAVQPFIECETRGLVRTKDGRDLEMFFANRLRPELWNGNGPADYVDAYERSFARTPVALPDRATG